MPITINGRTIPTKAEAKALADRRDAAKPQPTTIKREDAERSLPRIERKPRNDNDLA